MSVSAFSALKKITNKKMIFRGQTLYRHLEFGRFLIWFSCITAFIVLFVNHFCLNCWCTGHQSSKSCNKSCNKKETFQTCGVLLCLHLTLSSSACSCIKACVLIYYWPCLHVPRRTCYMAGSRWRPWPTSGTKRCARDPLALRMTRTKLNFCKLNKQVQFRWQQ